MVAYLIFTHIKDLAQSMERTLLLLSGLKRIIPKERHCFKAAVSKASSLPMALIVKEYAFLCMIWDGNADRPMFAAADTKFLSTGHVHYADMNVLLGNS